MSKLDKLFNSLKFNLVDRANLVLELKYNQEYDSFAEKITNAFPFRMTKSSKYVAAIDQLYLW